MKRLVSHLKWLSDGRAHPSRGRSELLLAGVHSLPLGKMRPQGPGLDPRLAKHLRRAGCGAKPSTVYPEASAPSNPYRPASFPCHSLCLCRSRLQ